MKCLSNYFMAMHEYDAAHEQCDIGHDRLLLVAADAEFGLHPSGFSTPFNGWLQEIYLLLSTRDQSVVDECRGGVVIRVTDTDVDYRMFDTYEKALDYYIDERHDALSEEEL